MNDFHHLLAGSYFHDFLSNSTGPDTFYEILDHLKIYIRSQKGQADFF